MLFFRLVLLDLSVPGTAVANTYNANIIVTNNTTGCSSTSAAFTVTISPTPEITLGANPAVCRGVTSASLTYSATVGSPDQYSINFDGTANAQGFVDITNVALPTSPISITVPAGAPAATYNGVLTIRNSTYSCVSGNYNITVTINPLPVPGVSGSTSVCINSTGNVYTTEAGMTNYLWTVSGGSITAGGGMADNSVTVTWGAAGTGHVIVNYTNGSGCTAVSATDQSITINALPVISIGIAETSGLANNDGIVCAGASVILSATGANTYSWTGGYYQWCCFCSCCHHNILL